MSESGGFPRRLVSARKMRNLNQEELAKKAGLQPAAVSHFETGTRKPSFDNLKKIAQALEVTTDYLMGKSDDPEASGDVNVAFRDALNGMTADQREMALNFMKMLKQQTTKKD